MLRRAARYVSRLARVASPRIRPVGQWDAIFTAGDFVAEQGRLPRPPAHAQAGAMDYFFWRKHEPWSDLEQRCCDKGLAKVVCQDLAPGVMVPKTVATVPLRDLNSGEQLERHLAGYLGQSLVMKPAHSNGGIVFLDKPDLDWDAYLRYAKKDFFPLARERQYHRLQPNLIIEEKLASARGDLPEDYKFFCFHGEPLLCQVDYDRFEGHKRKLYLLPSWEQLDVGYTFPTGERHFPKPDLLDRAMDACRALSRPFPFVRVDLYLMGSDIYFGEFTFTPDAGTKAFSDPAFDRALAAAIRSPDGSSQLARFIRQDDKVEEVNGSMSLAL